MFYAGDPSQNPFFTAETFFTQEPEPASWREKAGRGKDLCLASHSMYDRTVRDGAILCDSSNSVTCDGVTLDADLGDVPRYFPGMVTNDLDL